MEPGGSRAHVQKAYILGGERKQEFAGAVTTGFAPLMVPYIVDGLRRREITSSDCDKEHRARCLPR